MDASDIENGISHNDFKMKKQEEILLMEEKNLNIRPMWEGGWGVSNVELNLSKKIIFKHGYCPWRSVNLEGHI